MFALIVCLIGVKFLTNYRNGKNRVSSKNVYIPFQNLLYHFKMSTKYITVWETVQLQPVLYIQPCLLGFRRTWAIK